MTATNATDGPPSFLDLLAKKSNSAAQPVAAGPKQPTHRGEQWALGAVERQIGRLDALRGKPWRKNSYWDDTTFEVACALLRVGNHPQTPWTGDELLEQVRRWAPRDHVWGADEIEKKIISATRTVGAAYDDVDLTDSVVPPVTTLDVAPAGQGDEKRWFEYEPTEVAEGTGDTYALDVAREAHRLRVREAARELVAQERAGQVAIPTARSLTDLLAAPDKPVEWAVDQLLARGSRALLAAQHKAGKSHVGGNLVRAWADQTPFLGEFATVQLNKIIVIDNELGATRLGRWYRALGIRNTDRVDVIDLRGQAGTFNILDKSTRSRWAERLAGGDALLLDCLRPVLDALGLDEHREVGKFLEPFDELLHEAGIDTSVLIAHMGHAGERARGDSRVLDWPDEIWNLRRGKPTDSEGPDDDADVPRFFSAYGRESDVREGLLELDPATRLLTFHAGHSRAAAARDSRRLALRTGLLLAIGQHPGCKAGDLDGYLRDQGVKFTRGDEKPVVDELVRDGLVRREDGSGRARLHYLADDSPNSPGR